MSLYQAAVVEPVVEVAPPAVVLLADEGAESGCA